MVPVIVRQLSSAASSESKRIRVASVCKKMNKYTIIKKKKNKSENEGWAKFVAELSDDIKFLEKKNKKEQKIQKQKHFFNVVNN